MCCGDEENQNGESKMTNAQVVTSLALSIASMVIGYTAAYTSPALETLKVDEAFVLSNGGNITDSQVSWIGSFNPLFAILGSIVAGPLIDLIGRKPTMVICAPTAILAWLFIAMATSVPLILVGRSIGGFSAGIMSLCVPIYLCESLHPDIRGFLGLLPTTLGNSALVFCYMLGYFLNWRGLAYIGCLLPVPYLCLLVFVSDTPRWFVLTNEYEKANDSLQWLRGSDTSITGEIKTIVDAHKESEKHKGIFKMRYLKPTAICIGLMFFQQLSGINAVVYYAVQIFKESGSTLNSNVNTIIIGLVNVAASITASLLADRIGRKILLYISGAVMVISLISLGTYFYLKNHGVDITVFSWLPLINLIMYIFGFTLAYGPLPWLYMGEILPAKVRGRAAAAVTAFHWSTAFLVTYSFNHIKKSVGIETAFWVYSVFCMFSLVFTFFCLPETSRKSLEEIELLWYDVNEVSEPEPVVVKKKRSSVKEELSRLNKSDQHGAHSAQRRSSVAVARIAAKPTQSFAL